MLLKSTLLSIPTYFMSLFQAPISWKDFQRNFLRDSTDGAMKFHLVQWETVTWCSGRLLRLPNAGVGLVLKIRGFSIRPTVV